MIRSRYLAPVFFGLLLLLINAMACSSASDVGRVADTLEDRLHDALDFDGSSDSEGIPEGDPQGPPIVAEQSSVPSVLRLGEEFVIELVSDTSAPEEVDRVIVHVLGVKRHYILERTLVARADGRVSLFVSGRLQVDEELRGGDFTVELFLKTKDDVLGEPLRWQLRVPDEEPLSFPSRPIDGVQMDGEEWVESGRPQSSSDPNAPQITGVEAESQMILGRSYTIGLLATTPALQKASNGLEYVILSTPANDAYKRTTQFSVTPTGDGVRVDVPLKVVAESLVGRSLLLLFALEDSQGRVGEYVPWNFEVISAIPDGDADPEADSGEADVVVDGDGEQGDGDLDTEAEQADGDVVCTCGPEVGPCCDGCEPINEGLFCEEGSGDSTDYHYCKNGECTVAAPRQLSMGDAGQVSALSYSMDGGKLATIRNYNTIRIYDLVAGGVTDFQGSNSETFNTVLFDHSGNTLFSMSYENVQAWDLTASPPASSARLPLSGGGGGMAMAVSPKSQALLFSRYTAVGTPTHGVYVWRPGDSTTARQHLLPANETISEVQMSASGRYVFILQQKLLSIWAWAENSDATLLLPEKPAEDEFGFSAGALAPDEQTFVLGGCQTFNSDFMVCEEGVLTLYDAVSGAESASLACAGPIAQIAYSPDGALIAAAACAEMNTGGGFPQCVTYAIYLWAPRSRGEIGRLYGHATEITHLQFSPDGRRLASSDMSGVIYEWIIPWPASEWTANEDYCADDGGCSNSGYCNVLVHRCAPNMCLDNQDNDDDQTTDGNDTDCSNGGVMEVGPELVEP